MKMKLTERQQEMSDGKQGEAKKFCMDRLVDFGNAVDATEMADLALVLNECPIWSKDPRNPETLEKLNAYDLGHSRLYSL
jgi:Ser/Thr protein kinase RdoA (MazF antagonist)